MLNDVSKGLFVIVLGIDPGTRLLGVGVVTLEQGIWRAIFHDVCALNSRDTIEKRLFNLSTYLQNIYKNFKPGFTAIERVFFGRNADSAFKIGLARGVCMAEAGRYNSVLREYAPTEIKKGICGQGNADKDVVAMFIKRHLTVEAFATNDASDALAVALFAGWAIEKEKPLRSSGVEL